MPVRITIWEQDKTFVEGLKEMLIKEHGAVEIEGQPNEMEIPDDSFTPESYHGISLHVGTEWLDENKDVYDYLNKYGGKSSFVFNLKLQAIKYRKLSDKQTQIIRKIMREREGHPRLKTVNVGDKIILNKRGVKALNIDVHGLEVLEFHFETPKAYHITTKLTPYTEIYCCMCGQRLTNDESRKLGIGPICLEKVGFIDVARPLESLAEAWKDLRLERRWIPKFGIKEVIPKKEENV